MIGANNNDADFQEYVEVDPTGRYGRYDEMLGKGASKTVYRAFDEYQGIEVAWNQVNLQDFLQSPEDLERLYCEIHLLKTLKHKKIMKFYTSWVDVANRNINFITEMFNSGTLRQYRQKHRRVNIRAVKHWCRQILSGLHYLHSLDPPIIHRDLKCDNIFVNGNQGEVKIGDLGLAAILRKSHAVHCVGTPEFMAPEVYEEEYNELVDIYSFGMCVLEMVTFEYPYSECTHPVQIYKKVISGSRPEALYKVKDPMVRQFIEKCLATASQRLSARELLKDPFLQNDDNGFCSADGDFDLIDNLVKQPSFDLHSHGSLASHGFSKGSDQEILVDDGCYCDDADIKVNGIDLFHGQEDEPLSNLDITIKGRIREDGGIFLMLRVSDKDGCVRNIYFPFDIEADTALLVATEMIAELDITDHEVTRIAEMIDGEIGSLVPEWKPGPGIEENSGVPSTTCCQNCGSNVSSCGSFLDYLSLDSRGCQCAPMHGRFEEITFQVNEPEQSDGQQFHSQDSGGHSHDESSGRNEVTQFNNITENGTSKLLDQLCFNTIRVQSSSDYEDENSRSRDLRWLDTKHHLKLRDYKARKAAKSRRALHPSLDFDSLNSTGGFKPKPSFNRMESFHIGKHNYFYIPKCEESYDLGSSEKHAA